MSSFFWKSVLTVGLYLLLSFVFQGLSFYFGYKRYLLGAEILLALLLFTLGWRRLGAFALVSAIALELALGLSSVFYLFEKEQLWDMMEFLFQARTSYLSAMLLLPCLFFAVILVARRIYGDAGCRRYLLFTQTLVALALLQAQWVLSSEGDTFFNPTLADRQHLLFGSTAHFMREVMAVNRLITIGDRPDEHAEYVPTQYPSATKSIWGGGVPASRRVLLVIAEGWGMPKNSEVLDKQIESLRRNIYVKGLRVDKVRAKGATAAGELRELCWVVPTRLNFRRMTPEAVGNCLPAMFRAEGYDTVGIHGAYGGMYRRALWWPQIGLSKTLFKEQIALSQEPCYSFPGHCDRYLFDIVKNKLEGEKVFVYWLTLNSHMPYDRRDVANFRQDLCGVWLMDKNWEQLCNYQNLHTQFFEGLSALIQDQKMKGLEVLVVGDHPPLFNDEDSKDRFARDQVPVLHFVVQ
jgi:hypothetical protein